MATFNLTPVITNSVTFNAQFIGNQKNVVGNMGVVNATSNNYNDLNNKPSINMASSYICDRFKLK